MRKLKFDWLIGLTFMLAICFFGLQSTPIPKDDVKQSSEQVDHSTALVQDLPLFANHELKVVEFDHFRNYEPLAISTDENPTIENSLFKYANLDGNWTRRLSVPRYRGYPTIRQFAAKPINSKTRAVKSDFKIGWSHNRIYTC